MNRMLIERELLIDLELIDKQANQINHRTRISNYANFGIFIRVCVPYVLLVHVYFMIGVVFKQINRKSNRNSKSNRTQSKPTSKRDL